MNRTLQFTEESNRFFEAAPPHMQRIMIALDGIAAIEAGDIRPRVGRYFNPNETLRNELAYGDKTRSFRDLIANEDVLKNCTLCAKGAVFGLVVARRNQVTVGDVSKLVNSGLGWMGEQLSPVIGNVFSPETLRLMEVEFEGRDVEADNRPGARIRPVMRLDYQLSSANRLTAILRNIVDNDGELIPVAPAQEVVTNLYFRDRLPDWRKPTIDEWLRVDITRGDLVEGLGISRPIHRALKNRFRRWNDLTVSVDLKARRMPVVVGRTVGQRVVRELDTLYMPAAALEWMAKAIAVGQNTQPELSYGIRLPKRVVHARSSRQVVCSVV